ncbi:hypothetical protein M426DRAFT_9982 [Hypoxylon sp. CI-4A]|nr:hypothetical protein M426DRAFT_9982 [Hypoxylon sp. CI-4A]
MTTPLLQPVIRYRAAEFNQHFESARETYRRTREFFSQNARSIVFQKVLGFGGSGIVTLWSELSPYGQRVQDVAVKAPTDPNDPYFAQEIYWMSDVFFTAEHLVQLVSLQDEVLDMDFYNYDNPKSGHPNLIIMEYFERCDLNELLCRVNESVSENPSVPDVRKKLEYIPSRILWRIFLCLAKACVGMAYPPSLYNDAQQMQQIYSEVVYPEEDPQQIIHFDMHPFNVFVDDPMKTINDIPDHGFTPRFKLGDFGLTSQWDNGWTLDEKISACNVGRPGFQAPEQRHRLRINEEGAFGPHTNIWGAGYLMYIALTLYFTEDEDWAPTTCNITMPDGTSQDLVTWAPFLVGEPVYDEFKAYSTELRTLIARCMADKQEDRPSLDELVDTIRAQIVKGDTEASALPHKARTVDDLKRPPPVESDELLHRFAQEYFREPPVREDPYREYWDD